MEHEVNSPRMRFLMGLERCARIWLWICIAGLVGTIFGINPSWISVLALTGPLWVPIVALILWGRWIDEFMNFRWDQDDGPR